MCPGYNYRVTLAESDLGKNTGQGSWGKTDTAVRKSRIGEKYQRAMSPAHPQNQQTNPPTNQRPNP
jgi:hypothetical protein